MDVYYSDTCIYIRTIIHLSIYPFIHLSIYPFIIHVYTCTSCIAYCDIIPHLDCYDWIIKESQRYGEKWKKQWAQEYAIKKLILELPSVLVVHSVPVNTGLFPTWSHYLQEFLSHGM